MSKQWEGVKGICNPCRRLLCDNKPFDCEQAEIREDFWICKKCHDDRAHKGIARGKKSESSCDFSRPSAREREAWNTFKSHQRQPTRKSHAPPLEPMPDDVEESETSPDDAAGKNTITMADTENPPVDEPVLQQTQDEPEPEGLGLKESASQHVEPECPPRGSEIAPATHEGPWASVLSHRPPTPPISRRGSLERASDANISNRSTTLSGRQARGSRARKHVIQDSSDEEMSLSRVNSCDALDVGKRIVKNRPTANDGAESSSAVGVALQPNEQSGNAPATSGKEKIILRFKSGQKRRRDSPNSLPIQPDGPEVSSKKSKMAGPYLKNEDLLERFKTSATKPIVDDSIAAEGTETRPLDLVSHDGSQQTSPQMLTAAHIQYPDHDYVSEMISRPAERLDDSDPAVSEPWIEKGAKLDAFRSSRTQRAKKIRKRLKNLAIREELKVSNDVLQGAQSASSEETTSKSIRGISASSRDSDEPIQTASTENYEAGIDEAAAALLSAAVGPMADLQPKPVESPHEVRATVIDQPCKDAITSNRVQDNTKTDSSLKNSSSTAPMSLDRMDLDSVPGRNEMTDTKDHEEDRSGQDCPQGSSYSSYSIAFSPINRSEQVARREQHRPQQAAGYEQASGVPERKRRKRTLAPAQKSHLPPLLPSSRTPKQHTDLLQSASTTTAHTGTAILPGATTQVLNVSNPSLDTQSRDHEHGLDSEEPPTSGFQQSKEQANQREKPGPTFHDFPHSSQPEYEASELDSRNYRYQMAPRIAQLPKSSVAAIEDGPTSTNEGEIHALSRTQTEPMYPTRSFSAASTVVSPTSQISSESFNKSPATTIVQFGPERVRSSYPWLAQSSKPQSVKDYLGSTPPPIRTGIDSDRKAEEPIPFRVLNRPVDIQVPNPVLQQIQTSQPQGNSSTPSSANVAYPSPETPSSATPKQYVHPYQSMPRQPTPPPPRTIGYDPPRKGRGRPRLKTALRLEQTRTILPRPRGGGEIQPVPPRLSRQNSPQNSQVETPLQRTFPPVGYGPYPSHPAVASPMQGSPHAQTPPHLQGPPHMQAPPHMHAPPHAPPPPPPHMHAPTHGMPTPQQQQPPPGPPGQWGPHPPQQTAHSYYVRYFGKHLRETRLRVFHPHSKAFEVVHFGDSHRAGDLYDKVLRAIDIPFEQVSKLMVTFDWMPKEERGRTMVLHRDDEDMSFGHVHDEIQARFRMAGYCRTLIDIDVVLKPEATCVDEKKPLH